MIGGFITTGSVLLVGAVLRDWVAGPLVARAEPSPRVAAVALGVGATAFVWWYRTNPVASRALVREVLQLRVAFFLLIFAIGLRLAQRRAERHGLAGFETPDLPALALLAAAIVCGALFTIITNNVSDLPIDRISNPHRPLAAGNLPLAWYARQQYWPLGAALALSSVANLRAAMLLMTVISLYYMYSAPPVRLKRIPIAGKLVIPVNVLLIMMMGFAYLGMPIRNFPREAIGLVLVGLALVIAVVDVKDYEGDKAASVRTLPVVLGLRRAKRVLGVAIIAVHASLLIVLGTQPFVWMLAASGVVQALLVNREDFNERPILLLFLAGLAVSVCYYLA